VERQTMQLFFKDVTKNRLADGSASGLSQIYCDFIWKLANPMLEDPPDIAELHSDDVLSPLPRIMWAHGTEYNYERFVFLDSGINSVKQSVR
jgi:hypothetical protein